MYTTCLAAFDHSDFDKHILDHLRSIREPLGFETVICAHVEEVVPDGADGKEVQPESPDYGPGCESVALDGQPESALAECIRDRKVEIAIAGLKEKTDRRAQVGRRLLCMTDADMYFAPEAPARPIRKILVPVDLSDRSHELLERVRSTFPEAEIEIYFVNYIPDEMVMAKADRDRLIKESSDNLEQRMPQFIANLKSGEKSVTFGYGMSGHFNAGFSIFEHAQEGEFDLIAIGRLSTLDKELPFMGSVTQKLLSLNHQLPVLVINH